METHRKTNAVSTLTASQINNQQKDNQTSFKDQPNNEMEEIEELKTVAIFQRKPQFRLSENNRRRFC
ncbi:MAG: hypothetical protein H7296_09175 [Bacteroidia bacterium]|nr:hypothetical protein [Bacteroidia bacterium]